MLLLDRAPANAYDHRLLRDVGDALDALRVDEQVQGVVVGSASGRYFSAGADVGALAAGSPRQRAALCVLAHEVFRKIELTPVPVAAAIAGHALGGGLELALSCDARFVAEGEHRLGLPEIELGLFPGSGATQRLPRLIGLSVSLDLILSGRLVSPSEALAAGIVDGLLPDPNACLAAATAYVRSASAQTWIRSGPDTRAAGRPRT